MNYFVKLTKRPSVAVRAMITGLHKADAREDFKINMNTFGKKFENICYGCAATCAIQEIAGIEYMPTQPVDLLSDRALILFGKSYTLDNQNNLFDFELAIDNFRCGKPEFLLKIYGIKETVKNHHLFKHQNWSLTNKSWKVEIPRIENYIILLERQGY